MSKSQLANNFSANASSLKLIAKDINRVINNIAVSGFVKDDHPIYDSLRTIYLQAMSASGTLTSWVENLKGGSDG